MVIAGSFALALVPPDCSLVNGVLMLGLDG